jgi:NADH-quinone oxidoreductase subunit N
MLFSILGCFILVSSLNFLTLYLGLELVTLPLMALIPIVRKSTMASEAAMKYFVMSAMASGMFLFGVSLLYGVTKSFDVIAINAAIRTHGIAPEMSLLFGMMFILVGVGFKLGAVPFHMWIPDVYQGSPTSVTLYISTIPKLAGFGLAIRVLIQVFPALHSYWQQIIMIMAVLSLIIGNFAAISQQNFKRLLGYSTISHIGFVLLGLLAGPEAGFASALFYILTYAIMSLAAFGIIIALSHKGFEAENIDDFKGLASQEPWLAFLMMIVMLSFTGIPPLVGFYAKFWVLDALIKAGFVKLAILAVLITVISAYYYLRVVKLMYFDKTERHDLQVQFTGSEWTVLSINCLTILLLGIFPAGLFNICANVLK